MKRHAAMNRIYRLVWSRVSNAWVAVAENAKGRGKATSGRKLIAAALALAASALLAPLALAAPTGGQVSAGAGSIAQTGANTTITQSSQNLAINWQSFGIGVNEAVNFVQPNASAIALNRVLGQDPSQILGGLSANGQVFILNPNGVLFGTGSQVNVGGLVASTLSLSDADFIAGNNTFSNGGTAGAVVNRGTLTAAQGGYIALLAPEVRNEGVISATLGTALLAAGDKVTLTLNNGSLLSYSIDQGALNALADNKQLIQADGGQVFMSAKAANALSTAMVNNTGIIEARTVQNVAGVIMLMGDMQVGSVNVGGTLDASAPNGGNGGNGGFIETSAAHVNIADNAKITTLASNGLTGTWLIDPTNFTIAAGSGAPTTSGIGATTLSNTLGSTSVIIATAAAGAEAGDIFVNSAVTWAANKLTLSAHNNININANLNASGSASLALIYGQGAVAAGNTSNIITANGAAVNLPAGTTNFTTRQGSDVTVDKAYTVITSLGAAGSITAADLQGMNGNLGINYVLGSDIDATATSAWNSNLGFTPIGDATTPFTGTFDGLGHNICNLTVNNQSILYTGLFGYTGTDSAIRNVGLIGGSVSGGGSVGGLVGYNSGTVSNSYAKDSVSGTGSGVGGLVGENIGTVSNSYATGSVSGTGNVGGLVGNNNGGTVSNSYATGSVSGTDHVGGLAGNNAGTVSNSYAMGSVTGGDVDQYYAGGLVGFNEATGSVSNSGATGNVSGYYGVGGLVGINYGTIGNSYATGSVSGNLFAGGLAGYNSNQYSFGTISNSYATGSVSGSWGTGGLVGESTGTVSTSYATGSVIGTDRVGGLMGGNFGTVSNSYWNSSVNETGFGVDLGGSIGGTLPSTGTGLSTAQMRTASNFEGFNFTSTPTPGASGNNWVIVNADGTLNNAGGAAGATTPMLASEYSTTITSVHQLQLMQMVPDASYTLRTNIAASSTGNSTDVWGSEGFVPIGNLTTPFTGTFDGLGHTISNLTINRPLADNVGLFGYAGSLIQNVGLFGGSVTGRNAVGALVGYSYGTVSNNYSTANVIGNNDVGGLVGVNTSPLTVSNSYATGSVSGASNVGGLVGNNQGGAVSNSYATGSVSGASNVGRLVGNNTGLVSDSFWEGGAMTTGIGAGTTAGATGMITQDMLLQSNFTSATTANGDVNPGWNFSDTWVMYDGRTAPLLRVFMTPLTVTAGNASKTYDGFAYSGGNVTYFCCAPNDSNLLGTVSYSGTSQGAINVNNDIMNPYLITPGGLWSNQQGYIINYVDGMLTVNKAGLLLTGTQVYNGGTAYLGANLTANGITGETFAITGTGAAGNLASKNVQTSSTLASLTGLTLGTSNNGGLVGNYNDLSAIGSSVNVTAAPATVTANSDTKTYTGLSQSVSGFTASGLVNSETASVLSGVSASGSGTNAGSYTATAGVGTYNGNYILSFVDGTLTINKANLTVTADDKSRLYGQANPALSTTVSGFVNGETVGTAAGFTGAGSATTLADLTTNVGTAAITAGTGNLAATNYAFTNLVDGTLTINTPPAGGILPAVVEAIIALPGGADLLPAFSSTVTVAATQIDVIAPPPALSNLQYVYLTTTPGTLSGDIDTTVDGETVPTKAQGSKSDGFNERLPDAPIQFTGTVLVRNGGIKLSSDADDANARIK